MLKTASFGELFATAFLVNAIFHFIGGLLGAAAAILQPSTFNANGAPTQTPLAALGVLLVMLVVATFINAATSAVGSGIWVAIRRFFFRADRASVF